ncbi:MAG: ATP-binding protein [Solirubrobacterales bacterium]
MANRTIIKIDEDLCNGCGACISPCAEGALTLVEGKARVIGEALCDGAGFCLGVCPTGALSLETREAEAFSEHAVRIHQAEHAKKYIPQHCSFCKTSEEDSYLLPVKHRGEALWTCTRCLPRLIHG